MTWYDIPHIARAIDWTVCRSALLGAEHLPRTGPALVIVNHTTIADVPVVLASLDRAGLKPLAESAPSHGAHCTGHAHIRFLATREVFEHPLLVGVTRQSGFIPVEASGPLRAEAYREAELALRAGHIVALYPEGDVTSPGRGAPRRFQSGAARLALATGVPVVPMAHHDAREIGSGSLRQTFGGIGRAIVNPPRVAVVVGEPIAPAAYAGSTVFETTRLFHDRLTETWSRAAAARDRAR